MSFASNSPGHRIFVVGSYDHNFFKFGKTMVSMYWESRTIGNTSYAFGTDANGDGGTANDLIYIPRDTSEMNFQQFPLNGVTYTAAQQATAWDAYINQDPYLSKHRAVRPPQRVLPAARPSPRHERLAGRAFQGRGRHPPVQFRVDIENFTNMLNSNWRQLRPSTTSR